MANPGEISPTTTQWKGFPNFHSKEIPVAPGQNIQKHISPTSNPIGQVDSTSLPI
jgi:hypothetical protein